MGFLDFLFGAKNKQIQYFIENGAIVLDVRTESEWNKGHIKDAKHIPLQDLHNHVDELKTINKPFVVCCESGIRSAKATKFLNMKGIEATNGGGWLSLSKKL